jgi:hypothetical protein
MYEFNLANKSRLHDDFSGRCNEDRIITLLHENQQLKKEVEHNEITICQLQADILLLKAQLNGAHAPALKKDSAGEPITNERIRALHENGKSLSEIGSQLGMTRQAISYRLKKMGL